MNKRVKKLFVVILDNRLLFYNTNLKALHASAATIPGFTDSYVTIFRKFKEADYFTQHIAGKEYHFQKVI